MLLFLTILILPTFSKQIHLNHKKKYSYEEPHPIKRMSSSRYPLLGIYLSTYVFLQSLKNLSHCFIFLFTKGGLRKKLLLFANKTVRRENEKYIRKLPAVDIHFVARKKLQWLYDLSHKIIKMMMMMYDLLHFSCRARENKNHNNKFLHD